ncbi:MAG: LLM class flavin-dependent oxidoreductase, partial [Acidimicrobiales bacterium]
MRFGVSLAALHPSAWAAVTEEADRLGYESVWLPEHLVLPVDMGRSDGPGGGVGSPHHGAGHPPIPPEVPVFDAFVYLSFLAARTRSIRLGTHV